MHYDLFVCVVVEQNCDRNVSFDASNKWEIRAIHEPEIREHERSLFIRGSNKTLDLLEMEVSKLGLVKIAQAVAEFNGRKNVVKIGKSGFIV
jgi:hypothetical protein